MNFDFIIKILTPVIMSTAPIKIAVIDSGYNINNYSFKKCADEERDFSNSGMNDNIGHGQNVVHIISEDIMDLNYCIVPIKIFDRNNSNIMHRSILSFKYAILKKVDIINYSASGHQRSKEEMEIIKKALDMGIKVVVAAGNDGSNLDINCEYYPACYDNRLIVVGNLMKNGFINPTSNYGSRVNYWELGTKVTAGGLTLTGTSQATPKITAKEVRKIKRL